MPTHGPYEQQISASLNDVRNARTSRTLSAWQTLLKSRTCRSKMWVTRPRRKLDSTGRWFPVSEDKSPQPKYQSTFVTQHLQAEGVGHAAHEEAEPVARDRRGRAVG